ncbi:unnamed protein product [Zymoseptoria tritici ST99CH_3D1]|uniref:Phosphatidylinositol 4-kinase n=2 Tax=Zymoseptoria tritici TaxID=1047171 RepID=A0A1X7S487_ZYMT9|nr:unnamed protein product [Zymoseptoria tritici ST99CH_3D7]SMR58882.1 unnamed protein product [Zymoseptoria tritici ST99CH_1E4]SMR62730.1 unnamed protein product [Zymoseptoria tritici ST99CH_3D1]
MPSKRPVASGYARIAQAEEEEEERDYSENEDDPFTDSRIALSSPGADYASSQPRRLETMRTSSSSHIPQRRRANSKVDIKAINARLERWADEIKEKFTRRKVKGKSTEEEQLEIHHSVFQAPDWIRPATKEVLENGYEDGPEAMSKLEFDDLVESVRVAIELGLHPTLIAQGSSGSYFARNSGGKVVGVFKPKDEEPYASKNPKWTKWIHRNLFPFAFGRAMLIPNLSYVSEAAAYVLDCQLRTNLVPYTDVIGLSSKSFHYDWIDRRAFYRKKRPFPEKLGSLQVFLKGYKGATDFFREHPWPDQQSGFQDVPSQKRAKGRWDNTCRPSRSSTAPAATGDYDSDDEAEGLAGGRGRRPTEYWTEELQQSFREELEKLVILDYIMRNTDRGTDNWMIRVDKGGNVSIVKEPPSDGQDGYNRREDTMTPVPAKDGGGSIPRIGAIDNSLSWPWKHPDAWRSYPFGWLFMPVSMIGRPFSEKTKRHFLPLLTSKEWWSDTQIKLRRCFEIDADFQEKMFARQMAVMKGQAWNVVETLKTSDHGPLELTRRNRVHVWDDIVDIPVAVHLPRASEEMRRHAAAMEVAAAQKRTQHYATPTRRVVEEDEEMDISGAHPSPSIPNGDLLGLTTSSLPAGNPNRFNNPRHDSADDNIDTSSTIKESLDPNDIASQTTPSKRPTARRSQTNRSRMSHDLSRSTPWQHSSSQPRSRRFSLSFGSSSRRASLGYDDDGDLGYGAAATSEGSMRRVIVERLEVVKSKAPVFSWC